MAKKQKQEEEEVSANDISKSVLDNFLEKNEGDIWNSVESVKTTVSTGSLFLDAEISLRQGVQRFCGPAGAGKTSAAAMVCKNFLEKYKKAKVLWVKAEGRLSENIQLRSGVKFVSKSEDWDYGTAFILECNTMEKILTGIDELVGVCSKTKDRLLIVIDSIDGLKLDSDSGNELGKERTAGVPFLLKRYFQRSYYSIEKSGTVVILISQVTATIKTRDDYGPPALTSGGGGNSSLHWADYILEFSGRLWGDNILKNGPNTKHDQEKNPVIGHLSRIIIKKTDKENENKKVEYPIKHGRVDGNSIWYEHEVIAFSLKWGLLDQKGSWFNFSEEIIKDVKEKLNFDLESKHQGFNTLLTYLESNQVFSRYLFDRIRTVESK